MSSHTGCSLPKNTPHVTGLQTCNRVSLDLEHNLAAWYEELGKVLEQTQENYGVAKPPGHYEGSTIADYDLKTFR